MRDFLYRLTVFFTNLFFPPIAVAMLTGINEDVLINSCLLILAIIPSHIHGFYITCVYFHRRNKVKKGRYPGGPKPMIHSQNVLNGGFSDRVVDILYRREKGLSRRSSRRSHDYSNRRQYGAEPEGLRRPYSHHDADLTTVASRHSHVSRGSAFDPARTSAYDYYR